MIALALTAAATLFGLATFVAWVLTVARGG